MIIKFVDRLDELRSLSDLLRRGRPTLLLLYGRRRVGKTRLVQEFMGGKRGLYFYVPNAEEKTILSEFSRVVEDEFFGGFTFASFSSFMEYLAKRCGEGFIVAIDEFQRLINVDGAMSMIQKYWDERLSKSKCFLILSGSSVGAIRRVALRGDAPLYGRRTATLKIEPLKYLHLFEWFRRYSAEDLIKVYGAFGGTPAYLEHIDEGKTPEENVVEKILSKRSPLHDEPEMLLMEEIRAPQRYMDMLSAIAAGKNTMSEVADAVGLSRENTTTYLKTLEILDLIERVTPVTEPDAKRGLYRIRDPFFNFWFRFVRTSKRQLELGLEEGVWESIREEFNRYLGQVFEEVCRESLVEMARRNMLPIRVQRIGRWWRREIEINLLALETTGRRALALEAKWSQVDHREAIRILTELAVKAAQISGVEESIQGLMAKEIEGKEEIRNEGFIALDLQDIKNLAKNISIG